MSVEEAIVSRRSIRSYSGVPLTDDELSQLLWAAQGITDTRRNYRAAPSAGATFPLETYVVTQTGIYRYDPPRHALEELKTGDLRRKLASAAYEQSFVAEAGATIVFAAVPQRTTQRYGTRGHMYIHMEAGHAAQNVHLQAVALGLGSVPVGAFDDDAVASVLGLPRGQIPLYLIPVGR
ncbi:MAG: SagB/ThcOx family dehydrogenase [Verrucomicrobiae bacterium]|nr:SagB/ThcOx family dehydrogenase [Verrucomicrobiae bacterium]